MQLLYVISISAFIATGIAVIVDMLSKELKKYTLSWFLRISVSLAIILIGAFELPSAMKKGIEYERNE